jgi:hypothetical protein
VGEEIFAKQFDAAAGRRNKREQHTDGGGFACAVLPQETIYIAFLYRKRNIVNSLYVFELFAETLYINDCRHCIIGGRMPRQRYNSGGIK